MLSFALYLISVSDLACQEGLIFNKAKKLSELKTFQTGPLDTQETRLIKHGLFTPAKCSDENKKLKNIFKIFKVFQTPIQETKLIQHGFLVPAECPDRGGASQGC